MNDTLHRDINVMHGVDNCNNFIIYCVYSLLHVLKISLFYVYVYVYVHVHVDVYVYVYVWVYV